MDGAKLLIAYGYHGNKAKEQNMPSIDQIIQDEIGRIAKREIKNAVGDWLRDEISDTITEHVKTAIQPFLVAMNDQRKVIEALRAQLDVASQPSVKKVPVQPAQNGKKPPSSPTKPEFSFPLQDGTKKKAASKASRGKSKIIDPAEVANAPRPKEWYHKNEPRLPKERIVKVREKLGITQVQLAKLVGVDAFTIQNWESGRTVPSVEQKRQIAYIRDLNRSQRRQLFVAKKILRRGAK